MRLPEGHKMHKEILKNAYLPLQRRTLQNHKDTQQAHDVIMTSDRRRYDVILASFACWVPTLRRLFRICSIIYRG